MPELLIVIVVPSIVAAAIVLLTKRLRQRFPTIPASCHLAAAIALALGCATIITGIAHSFAVASLAARMSEYGPLQVLWFTTGVMLIYTGAMNVAFHRAVAAGHLHAVWATLAASFLFILYLLFVNPLPGGGGTVPPMLGAWSLQLVALFVAALSLIRRRRLNVRVV